MSSNDTVVMMPPTGPTGPPMGINGVERSYSVDIIVCSVITALIGTIFVGLRFYARGVIMHVLALEDWLILVAQVFSIATSIGYIHQAALGLGQHWWWLDFANVVPMSQAGWYSILFYELSIWFAQTAILILYLRIWTFPWVRRCTCALIGIITAYNIFVFVSIFTACIPLEAYWDFTVPAKYCHSLSIWFANTYLHIATDFLIYLLPIPVILRLRFPRRQKILLFVLFAFGFFVCLISIIRLVYLIMTNKTMDVPYDYTVITFWTTVETNATVVIACFMTMKPLLARWFPNLIDPHATPNEMGGQNAAGPDANGRVPTIGSTPIRSPNSGSNRRNLWTLSNNDETATHLDRDEKQTVDLEAADHASSSSSHTEKTHSVVVEEFRSSP